jgi:hypothetical protein
MKFAAPPPLIVLEVLVLAETGWTGTSQHEHTEADHDT